MREILFNVPVYDFNWNAAFKKRTIKPKEISKIKGEVAFERYGHTWIIHTDLDYKKGRRVYKISEYTTGAGIPLHHTNKRKLISLVKKFLNEREKEIPKEFAKVKRRFKKDFGKAILN